MMRKTFLNTLLSILFLSLHGGLDLASCRDVNISIIVAAQPLTTYFSSRYLEIYKHLTSQLPYKNAKVEIFHTNFDEESSGDWIIAPLLLRKKSFFLTQDWIFICDDDTRVDVPGLVDFLSTYDARKPRIFGLGLYDDEPTIIHHFSFHDGDSRSFKYTNRAFGYVMSGDVVKKLIKLWESTPDRFDFRIDIDHEIMLSLKESFNVKMNEENEIFCKDNYARGCITWLKNYTRLGDCGKRLGTKDIFFAVKTCQKFLEERIPYLKRTWVDDTEGNIGYFAEIKNDEVPTIKLNIRNYDGGYCSKMREIIRWFYNNKQNTSWLFIADDDTLLSVPRLQQFLACSDPTEPQIIGERYGYRQTSDAGYDYITGGGGIALSQSAVKSIVAALGAKHISCPTNDAPDDMTLGMWAKDLKIPVLHSPLFHQARPMDYPGFLINMRKSISYHKFWNCEPEIIYQRWLLAPNRRHKFSKILLKEDWDVPPPEMTLKSKVVKQQQRLVEEL